MERFMCLNSGDILRDRYKIIAELGRGGSAITYRAFDRNNPENSLCVVKEIRPHQSTDPRALERAKQLFEREATTLNILSQHPRIPAFIEHFQENGLFYIVQEYIDGHSLQKEFIPNHRQTEEQVTELLRDILEILKFVHENNVIHRDITPSNLIRRNSDENIVLIDFGAVKEIGTVEITASGRTKTTTIGTPGYSAPEQLNGQPRLCSDIYSVGLIAIQFLTGVNPRELPQDPRTGEIIWNYSLPDRPMLHVNQRLAKILNKMVRYHFNHRYQSVAKVLRDLDAPPLPWNWLLLAIAPIAIAGTIAIARNNIFPSKTALVFKDGLSAGEEILFAKSNPWLKKKGVEGFAASNPQPALKKFKESWQKEYGNDPETLVYINNAFLEANKIPYYTIAVALPIGSRNPDSPNHIGDRAKEVLRGVAFAQTEVNVGLAKSKGDRDFPGQGFLPNQAINGKGLKVIIADDANDESEAKKIASLLAKQPEILAVVGHTNSEMTMAAVDEYDRNNLVAISSGASTEELTSEPKKFFFRTQYTSSLIAKDLADYLLAKKQKQATIIYNPSNPFSTSFKQEFTKYFRDSKGGKIVRIRDFDLSKKDFNAQRAIKELQGKGETAIALVPDAQVTTSLNNAVEIVKLNNDRHWIVGAWTLMRSETLELASQREEKSFKKIILSVGWHPLNSPNKAFPQQARSLWGGEVNTRTASAYDAARALIKALEMQQNPSREGMQKMLSSPDFRAEGATGTIQFNSPTNGDRKNPPSDLVHIVECPKEQFGLAFVPVKYATATAAGLKCD
ncbi:bifunctional serine/threonine-protein kinase/ABC transporter substrate-binding protein [Microcoleus sp. EPA2]|uniref:bifunctional serine/threonine-protein kinase/ABC transporter substrate-binding protein n=1 Tax=Microcoleus sp. EPA2 TaxID=2841654 RepID=UPI00312B8812